MHYDIINPSYFSLISNNTELKILPTQTCCTSLNETLQTFKRLRDNTSLQPAPFVCVTQESKKTNLLALLISTAINWCHTITCRRERDGEDERDGEAGGKEERKKRKKGRERKSEDTGRSERTGESEEEGEKEKRGSGLKYPPS